MRLLLFFIFLFGLITSAFIGHSVPVILPAEGYQIDTVAENLRVPWQIVFLPDRSILFTEREGRVRIIRLRVNDDGSIPNDNPFVKNDTARKEIWSFGHRNPQGIAFQPVTGLLYESEHGPTGGDEINLIKKGDNYGWPGVHHDDKRAGMESPLVQYTPSIGPGEVLFYNGVQFPQLTGKLLVACLRGEDKLQGYGYG